MLTFSLNKVFYNNIFIILAILTLSLGVFSIDGYAFTMSNFLIIYLFLYYLIKNNKIIFLIYFLLITYLLFLAVFFLNNLNFIEFLKSFLLTSIMLLVFLSSLIKPIYSANLDLKRIFSYLGVFVVTFECIQICEYFFFDSSNTWFLLDRFSISTATDVGRFQAVNFLSFMRPISFYHEPSYLGIVLLILLICANELKIKQVFIIIYYIGIIISFSTTALVFLVLYVLIKNFNNLINIFYASTITLFLFIFLLDAETLNTIFRFSEIFNAGTSGNERLIGPFDYLMDQFFIKNNYFGIPLGQSDLVFNNSFYLLFLYFGILTPFLLLIFIFFIFQRFKKNAIKYLLAFFSLLFLSGAIFTLEDALILYLLNFTFNLSLFNIKHSNVYLSSN